jgi:acetylornithine/succinyldiaminopimelate/putrescine aminotransferase
VREQVNSSEYIRRASLTRFIYTNLLLPEHGRGAAIAHGLDGKSYIDFTRGTSKIVKGVSQAATVSRVVSQHHRLFMGQWAPGT